MQAANGVIASTSLKRHGRREQPIDPIRVSRFVEATRRSVATLETKAVPSVPLPS